MSTPMSGGAVGGTATQHDRLSVSVSTEPPAPEDGGQFDTSTDVGNTSVGALVSEVLNDLSTLMRKEIELAKAEVRQEATKAGKGVGMLGGAAVAGWFTLMFASLTLIWVLDLIMPLSVAALIVTLLWGIGAAVLAITGRKKLQQVKAPEQTVESLKEDVQWAKGQSK